MTKRSNKTQPEPYDAERRRRLEVTIGAVNNFVVAIHDISADCSELKDGSGFSFLEIEHLTRDACRHLDVLHAELFKEPRYDTFEDNFVKALVAREKGNDGGDSGPTQQPLRNLRLRHLTLVADNDARSDFAISS